MDERNAKILTYQETNDEELATELLLEYESMVRMAATKISRNRPDLYEDLFQVGQISLLQSLQQFDCALGFAFEPYVMKRLIGHMKNYLRDKSWYIQVPRRIKEKGVRVQKAIDDLTMRLERSPTVEEIAEYLELSVEETIEVLAGRDYYQFTSLETPLTTDEDSATIGDMVGSDINDYQTLENRLDLEDALKQLSQEEQTILKLAYIDGHSQRTIGEHLGISQMSVSRIQKRAIAKLKTILSPDKKSATGS